MFREEDFPKKFLLQLSSEGWGDVNQVRLKDKVWSGRKFYKQREEYTKVLSEQEGPRGIFEQVCSDQYLQKNVRARVGQKEAGEVEQSPAHVGPCKSCVYHRLSPTPRASNPMRVSLNKQTKTLLFSNKEAAQKQAVNSIQASIIFLPYHFQFQFPSWKSQNGCQSSSHHIHISGMKN